MDESSWSMMDGNMSMGPCDSMSGMDMNMSMSMAMQFFFGYQCSFLFPNVKLDTPGGLFGGIVVVIIVAVLYEGLKTLREILASLGSKNSSNKQEGSSGGEAQKKNGDMSLSSSVQSSSHVTNTHVTNHERTPLVPANKKRHRLVQLALDNWLNPLHILQSFLHVIQVGVAYLLMLVAMTYNGWLFLSVCIGAGLGYFIFARCRRSMDDFRNSDHCHN